MHIERKKFENCHKGLMFIFRVNFIKKFFYENDLIIFIRLYEYIDNKCL